MYVYVYKYVKWTKPDIEREVSHDYIYTWDLKQLVS